MGTLASITCRNKDCRYHTVVRVGTGMIGFANLKKYEENLISGVIENNEVLDRLQHGAILETGACYRCTTCRVIVNDNAYYLVDNLTYSPFGTARYDVVFPFGKPRCKCCGNELEFLENVLSSKVKCPCCHGDLKTKIVGYFD